MFHVVLADDEKIIGEGMKKFLEQDIGDIQVDLIARNGQEAYEYITTHKVDFLVTDIKMPVMNGLELMQKLRENHYELPILILSGYKDFVFLKEAIKQNAVDYILKPINREECFLTVEKIKAQLQEASQSTEELLSENKLVNDIVQYINNNMSEPLSLNTLADETGYSYAYISTLFKKELGETFSDYILRKRMERAKKLLKESNLKIYEIGRMCGFSNEKYFFQMFKSYNQTTPLKYRNSK